MKGRSRKDSRKDTGSSGSQKPRMTGPTRGTAKITRVTPGPKKAGVRIKLAKDEWEQTFDALPDMVAVIDDRHVIRRANRALAARLGVERDSLIGRSCYRTICGIGKPHSGCPGSKSVETGKEQMEEKFLKKLHGHYLISCTPVSDSDGGISSFVEVCRDISELKKMEERLREAAITDPLTGLFNRRGFLTLAQQQLNLAHRNKRNLMLLFLDLNKMKEINDKFGHKEGDRALTDTAEILRKTFRKSDIIGRMGGDEFAVLLTEPSRGDIANIVFGHIQRTLKSYNERGRPYRLSFSMGAAYYAPERPCSVDDLLMHADSAMYEDKKRHGLQRI